VLHWCANVLQGVQIVGHALLLPREQLCDWSSRVCACRKVAHAGHEGECEAAVQVVLLHC
jgi:hypothetical protein